MNTRLPDLEQSPEWVALRGNDFRDFRLDVVGLVETPRSFSLDELKALSSQDQITMHTCMQLDRYREVVRHPAARRAGTRSSRSRRRST